MIYLSKMFNMRRTMNVLLAISAHCPFLCLAWGLHRRNRRILERVAELSGCAALA